jgi:hypothetical protein
VHVQLLTFTLDALAFAHLAGKLVSLQNVSPELLVAGV